MIENSRNHVVQSSIVIQILFTSYFHEFSFPNFEFSWHFQPIRLFPTSNKNRYIINVWHRNHQNIRDLRNFIFFCLRNFVLIFFNSWKFVIRNSWIHEVNSSFVTYLDWYLSCLAIQTPGGLRMEPWKLHLKQFEGISTYPERTVWRNPCECGHKFEQLSGENKYLKVD